MNKKVLVVDDSEHVRNFLCRTLNRDSYKVTSADSAETALDILEDQTFPLLLIDLQLPGIDGVEFCRKIRNKNPISLMVAVTAHSSLFDLAKCREAGFDDYYVKPVTAEDVLAIAADAYEKIERWTRR